MAYNIEYKRSALAELKKIDKGVVKRIIRQLETNLGEDPGCGSPLKGQFKGLFKYRVGEYRVIFSRTKGRVLVLRIGQRSKVYK